MSDSQGKLRERRSVSSLIDFDDGIIPTRTGTEEVQSRGKVSGSRFSATLTLDGIRRDLVSAKSHILTAYFTLGRI